jgi:TPR repeat protein
MFLRMDAIERFGKPGHWLPILRSLAVQGVPEAQYALGNVHTDERWAAMFSPALAVAWYQRAIRQGHPTAMYNLAITYRNWGDMAKYRYWLARAARLDLECRDELKAFRTRFPHEIMRRWHRYAQEC